MRPPERRLALLACAAIIALSGTACTSSTPDAAGSSTSTGALSGSVIDTSEASSSEAESQTRSVTSSPAIPTPSVIDVPPPSTGQTSASLDPEAKEAADRAAVEAAWTRYWDVYTNIVRTSPDQRSIVAAEVSVDPAQTNLSKSAEYFESKGQDTYGSVTHRLSWLEPINGSTEAVLADCQDQSNFGAVDVATKKKVTVGVERDNIKAHYVKGVDGVWRVSDIYFLVDIPC